MPADKTDSVNPSVVIECAQHLVLIANELRSMGDVDLVMLSEDGVTPCQATLADELWTIAVRLGAPIDGNVPDGR